jgi:hypothetical protein
MRRYTLRILKKLVFVCLAFSSLACSKKEDRPQPLVPEVNEIVLRVNNTDWRAKKAPVIIPLRFTMITTPYYFYKLADVKSGTTTDSVNLYIPITSLDAYPEKKTYSFERQLPGGPVGSGARADLFFNGKKYTTASYLNHQEDINSGIKTAGTITIESYEIRNNRPAKITGKFNAKMRASDGSEITVTDGAFKELSLN